jgi:hypothetical protein
MQPDYIRAHTHSSNHRDELLRSDLCGCFFCLSVYPPGQVKEWTDEDTTAFCPECGIDSVIGSASGFPVEKEFLGRMRRFWFW